MDTIRAAALAVCGLATSFCTNAQGTTAIGDALSSVAPPPHSKPLGRHAVSAGGQQSTYMTSATPEGVISFYKQLLPAAGWTVTDTNSDDEFRKGRCEPSSHQRSTIPGAKRDPSDRQDLC